MKCIGECRICGEQAYYRGKESDWKISFQKPTEPNTSTWVHSDWSQHALPGEDPKEYEKWGKLAPYDHDAEPVTYTHVLMIEVDSYLSSVQQVMVEVNLVPFKAKVISHMTFRKEGNGNR